MREPARDIERLRHILEAIDTIEKSRTIHTTEEAAADLSFTRDLSNMSSVIERFLSESTDNDNETDL